MIQIRHHIKSKDPEGSSLTGRKIYYKSWYMKKNNVSDAILQELEADRHVQEMKHFIQHGKVTTYEHCRSVARLSGKINERFSLHADPKTLMTGAMLHDFYLYDWHAADDGRHRLHGFTHAGKACRNAKKYFDIDEDVSQVIYCHMWPLNPERVPTSREAWIVCIADKCISLYETLFKRK